MKKTKVLSVLVAVIFCFNIVSSSFAASVRTVSMGGSSESVLDEKEYTTPLAAAEEEEEKTESSGKNDKGTWYVYKAEQIKKFDNDYYVEFSIGSNKFLVEVDDFDKGKIDAYPTENLYAEIREGAKPKGIIDGIEVISKEDSKIMTSDSYSYSSHVRQLKIDNGTIDKIEEIKLQNSEQKIYVGTFFNEQTNKFVYVEISKEYVDKIKSGEISKEDINFSININENDYVKYIKIDDGRYVIPKENVKFEVKEQINVSGLHKVGEIKREDDKYYISFSVNSKTYWVEVTKEEDKNEIDAYDRGNLGLYVDIPKGAEVNEGVVSQYTTIYNPDSYSATHYASDINVNGLTVTNIHKETVKVPTGRSPEEREIYVGMVTTETGRNIYVEVPEEYVGKDVTISINISDTEYVKYYKGDNDKYVIPKENVKFEVNTTKKEIIKKADLNWLTDVQQKVVLETESLEYAKKLLVNYKKQNQNKIKKSSGWKWLTSKQQKAVLKAKSFKIAKSLLAKYVKQNKNKIKKDIKKYKFGFSIKQKTAILKSKFLKSAKSLLAKYKKQNNNIVKEYTKEGFKVLKKLADTVNLDLYKDVFKKCFKKMGVSKKELIKAGPDILRLLKKGEDFVNCAANAVSGYLGISRPLAAIMNLASELSIDVTNFVNKHKNRNDSPGTTGDAIVKTLQKNGHKNAKFYNTVSLKDIMNFKGKNFIIGLFVYSKKNKKLGGHVISITKEKGKKFGVSDNLINDGEKIIYTAKEFEKFLKSKTAKGKTISGKTKKIKGWHYSKKKKIYVKYKIFDDNDNAIVITDSKI